MRYDFIHIIAVALLCCVSLNSCRAKKDIQRNEETTSRTERVERFVDTTRVTAVDEERSERSGSEVEHTFTRVTEFDSTGSIRKVSETWRDRQLSRLDTKERHARTVSIAGVSEDIIVSDTSSTVVNEMVKVDTDSRPVQGIEWLWVVLSVALIASVVLYIIYNRVK
jgi:hypothetical protein